MKTTRAALSQHSLWSLSLSLLCLIGLPACRLAETRASSAQGSESPVVAQVPAGVEGSVEPEVQLRVLASTSFIADIVQNVAGDRLQVDSLIPIGVDPHGFEPAPSDLRRVADSQVLIVNGGGFEEFLGSLLENVGGERLLIEASAGLEMRQIPESEEALFAHAHGHGHSHDHSHGHSHAHDGDPHFYLDPLQVIRYVENIRAGLTEADPPGADVYAENAAAYIAQLQELDAWIQEQVAQIPEANRLLVTNHDTLGYFADRYGFRVIGTILPGVSTNVSPSAQELASLIDTLQETQVPAIFLETGNNPQLAEQLAQELNLQVKRLYSHSTSTADGPAATYLDMMRYNTETIVTALQ
ncbi:metal ABC transporter substrate-binding protein [Synechococcus sp. Nb3U1]|uniref:metal ABC transporter substrate-binding protein n=1 Tax=Synechococcus sp. Nb3U1 TaxID=1914529 RepID=UPI001F331DF7|nr:metal ABC transporter substrate-binding protein [Synechococcus sp. Nb3U1]MCF2972412.1 metal ABC transporter substrate-binding protein [Synechococcus sp. Nb3U1]